MIPPPDGHSTPVSHQLPAFIRPLRPTTALSCSLRWNSAASARNPSSSKPFFWIPSKLIYTWRRYVCAHQQTHGGKHCWQVIPHAGWVGVCLRGRGSPWMDRSIMGWKVKKPSEGGGRAANKHVFGKSASRVLPRERTRSGEVVTVQNPTLSSITTLKPFSEPVIWWLSLITLPSFLFFFFLPSVSTSQVSAQS